MLGSEMFELRTKLEHILIKLRLTGSAYFKNKEDIGILVPGFKPLVIPEDFIDVEVNFNIAYVNDINCGLQAILNISKNPEVVISVSCTELKEGRILIYETLLRLDKLIKQLD